MLINRLRKPIIILIFLSLSGSLSFSLASKKASEVKTPRAPAQSNRMAELCPKLTPQQVAEHGILFIEKGGLLDLESHPCMRDIEESFVFGLPLNEESMDVQPKTIYLSEDDKIKITKVQPITIPEFPGVNTYRWMVYYTITRADGKKSYKGDFVFALHTDKELYPTLGCADMFRPPETYFVRRSCAPRR